MQKTQNFQTSVAKSYQYLPTIFFFTLYYGLCELKKKNSTKTTFLCPTRLWRIYLQLLCPKCPLKTVDFEVFWFNWRLRHFHSLSVRTPAKLITYSIVWSLPSNSWNCSSAFHLFIIFLKPGFSMWIFVGIFLLLVCFESLFLNSNLLN